MGNKQSSNQSSNKIYEEQTKNQRLLEEFIEKIRNMETFSDEDMQSMNQMSEEDRMKFFLTYNEIIDYVNHFMSHDKFESHQQPPTTTKNKS